MAAAQSRAPCLERRERSGRRRLGGAQRRRADDVRCVKWISSPPPPLVATTTTPQPQHNQKEVATHETQKRQRERERERERETGMGSFIIVLSLSVSILHFTPPIPIRSNIKNRKQGTGGSPIKNPSGKGKVELSLVVRRVVRSISHTWWGTFKPKPARETTASC